MTPTPDAHAAAYPSGTRLRAWTRRRTRRHESVPLSETLADAHTILLTVAVALAMGVGLARGLAGDAADALAAGATAQRHALVLLDPSWLVAVGALLLLTATWSITARLGPVGAPRHWRVWWLAAPGERRTLLRPALATPALAAAALGMAAGLVVGLTVPVRGPTPGPAILSVLAPAIGLAALAVTGVAVQALAQVRAGQRPPVGLIRAADVLLLLVVVAGVALALARPAALALPGPTALAAATTAALALAAAAVRQADRTTDRLRDRALRSGGDVAAESAGALHSMDTRALGRALDRATGPAAARGTRPGTERPWSASRLVRAAATRAPRTLRPQAALVASDLILLIRTPRHVAQVVAGALLTILALAVPGSSAVLIAGLAVGAYVAALALVEGARQGQLAPAIDAVLPLGQASVRATRLVLPALVLAWWGAAMLALSGGQLTPLGALAAAGAPLWAALGALTGVGVAAGALRGAYRPVPTFGGQPIVTPFGIVPPGLRETVSTGPDVAILALVPAAVAIVLGTVPPALLLVHVAVTAAAVALGLRRPKST